MQSVIRQWYAAPLQALLARKQAMPHAILLTGPVGAGKEQFAAFLTAALMCKSPTADHSACGHCQSCQLLAAHTHPDFYPIELKVKDDDKLAKDIGVDQIRQLCQSLSQTSQLSGKKIAVIDPAEKMNRNAANSLLKTLEEPTKDTLLILLSAQPSRLLATVRSRCQKLALKMPTRETVVSWLQQQCPNHNAEALYAAADGAPFAALALAQSDELDTRSDLFKAFCGVAAGRMDPVTSAAQWAKCEPDLAFRWLGSWLQDLTKLASGQRNPQLQNTDLEKSLHALVSRIDLRKLFYFQDCMQRSLLLVRGNANLQLVHESLQLEWSKQCVIKP